MINAVGKKTLIDGESRNICISLDLVDVAVLVLELAANPVRALASREEGFAVFIFSSSHFLGFKFFITVGKFALVSVAAKSNLNPVLAELRFVLRLVLVRFGTLN